MTAYAMTPTQIEATWPREVVEAWHWVKTNCRHWATVGHDWQTLDEMTDDAREEAERCMVILCMYGLVEFAKTPPRKKKPGRCGQPNFKLTPFCVRNNHV